MSRTLIVLVVLLATQASSGFEAGREASVNAITSPSITRDGYGIALIQASDDVSAAFGLGIVHAQDRLFQIDLLRRQASGQLAELLGPAALASDVQLRTLGLRRAATATAAVLEPATLNWLQAYADGVNSVITDVGRPLPPEYAALELTRASIPMWTTIDSLVVLKLLTFGWSFDLSDLDLSIALAQYEMVGGVSGFDGEALLFQDLFRSAPFAPATIAKSSPAKLSRSSSVISKRSPSSPARSEPVPGSAFSREDTRRGVWRAWE